MPRIRCPQCGKSYEMPDRILGKDLLCNACGTSFRVDESVIESGEIPLALAESQDDSRPASVPPPAHRPEPETRGEPASEGPWQEGLAAVLRRLFVTLARRARWLKLQHEIRGLRKARAAQWAGLGLKVLGGERDGLDVAEEVAEIENIQKLTAEKRQTLASLKGTPGAGPVARDLNKELAILNNRQRDLVCAMGRKAAERRAEQGGSDGAAMALDRIRETLAAKEEEAGELEAELGPFRSGEEVLTLRDLWAGHRTFCVIAVASALLLLMVLLWIVF